jgi:hypothetical protein
MINFLLPLSNKHEGECSIFSQGNHIVARLYKHETIIQFRNVMFFSLTLWQLNFFFKF